MKIPSDRQWTQDNSGDVLGILGDTKNMSMDTIGKAQLSRKAAWLLGTNQDNGFGYPLAINYFDGQYVALTDNQIFTFNAPNFTADDKTFTPNTGLNSDAVVFNGLYTFTVDDTLYTWNGGTLAGDWDDQGVALTSGVPHPEAVFDSLAYLAIGDANTVKLVDTAYSVVATMTIPANYQVTTMRYNNGYLYVGTKNLNGGNAKVYIWDGSGSAAQYECEVGAPWVFSMTEYLSTVAVVTSQGQLGIVNGTNFQQLDAFPVYYDPHARWQDGTGLLLNGKVFNRGMCTIGDTIYINIDGEVSSGFMPEMRSGVWVYDPSIGLYHRSASSTDELVRDSSLTLNDSVLTTSAPHLLKTGDAVLFSNVLGLTGVDNDVVYYVKVESGTEIKLAQSRKALQKGNYIVLGGTPGGSDTLVYTQNSDYGLTNVTSGAITPTFYEETPYKHLTSEVLWSSRMTLPDNTAEYGIFSFADSYNIGSLTTQRIASDNITQSWKELYNFIDGLQVDTEKVIVKAQTKFEATPNELSGVWLSANQLNNANPNDYSAWSDIELGDEIVVVDGYGRGQTAHVLEINPSSSTISLTLDENLGTINETCTLYYTSFKKMGQALTYSNKEKDLLKSALDGVSAPYVVIKLELRGYSLAVNVMELSNGVKSKSN